MSLGPVGELQHTGHSRIVRGRSVNEPWIVAVVLAIPMSDIATVDRSDRATYLLHDATVNSQVSARRPAVIVDDAAAAGAASVSSTI